jgi:hypothetical protein
MREHVVFIGGFFYDPFFGPYPWWPRAMYPYPYFPIYDSRAELRVLVIPKTAAVYVDGFYAGTVDDFDGVFQSLPLPPGGHTIQLYLEGYRTVRQSVYLRPGSTFRLRETLERLPPGAASEPPQVAPPVPAPPPGSVRPPVTPPRTPMPPPLSGLPPETSFGTLQIMVRPVTAAVTIDGVQWLSSEGGYFAVEVPAGRHHVEAVQPGYARFSQDVDVRPGEVTTLNISLARPG